MESNVKERLKCFIQHLGLSNRAFEKQCNLSNGLVNNIKKSVSPTTLDKLSKCYPELNLGWLLSGEGEMLKTIDKNSLEDFNYYWRYLVDYFIQELEAKRQDYIELRKEFNLKK
jgi:hypothetical protein